MEQLKHAVLAPSSMGVTVHCAGSVPLQLAYPQDEDTIESREGTASHWVASSVLESYKRPGGTLQLANDFVGQHAPNGVMIDQEMADGANEYVREVLRVVQEHGALQDLYIEDKISIGRVHPENWGTPDSFINLIAKGKVYVFDYKYGHKFVEVFENWQLMDYGVGILDLITGGNGISDQHITVEFCIVQPRSFGHGSTVRNWSINASDLRPYVNVMEAASLAALGPNPTTKSGTHCVNCSARRACTTAQDAAYIAVEISGLTDSNVLEPAALGLELLNLKRAEEALKARITGLEEQACKSIREGKNVPWWGPKNTYSRQKWIKPKSEVLALGELFEIDLKQPMEVITPKQAIKAGVDESIINAYSTIQKTGFKLVFDDGTEAKRVFSK